MLRLPELRPEHGAGGRGGPARGEDLLAGHLLHRVPRNHGRLLPPGAQGDRLPVRRHEGHHPGDQGHGRGGQPGPDPAPRGRVSAEVPGADRPVPPALHGRLGDAGHGRGGRGGGEALRRDRRRLFPVLRAPAGAPAGAVPAGAGARGAVRHGAGRRGVRRGPRLHPELRPVRIAVQGVLQRRHRPPDAGRRLPLLLRAGGEGGVPRPHAAHPEGDVVREPDHQVFRRDPGIADHVDDVGGDPAAVPQGGRGAQRQAAVQRPRPVLRGGGTARGACPRRPERAAAALHGGHRRPEKPPAREVRPPSVRVAERLGLPERLRGRVGREGRSGTGTLLPAVCASGRGPGKGAGGDGGRDGPLRHAGGIRPVPDAPEGGDRFPQVPRPDTATPRCCRPASGSTACAGPGTR